MRIRANRWVPVALLALSAACFHQVVQTGLEPGSTVIDKPFVSTWLFGLVPAAEIDTRPACPSGVAVVTTEQSFVNSLAGMVTLGIWTPEHVQITCASRSAALPRHAAEIDVAQDATAAQRDDALLRAVNQSLESHEAVVVRY